MAVVALDQWWRDVHVPVLALVLVLAFGGPDPEHDLHRFAHHDAILTVHAVDAERHEISQVCARANSELQASLREMVEKGNAMSQLDRDGGTATGERRARA